MWSSDEFKNYLRKQGKGSAWEEVIYPGMKKAITCALLCTQDVVEYRKVGALPMIKPLLNAL